MSALHLYPIRIIQEEVRPAERERLLALRVPGVSLEEAEAQIRAELEGESIIPLRILQGIPFLKARIEGRPYLLQLDFGSRYTFLQPEIALRHRLPLISEEFLERGPGEGFSFYLGRVKEIQLGKARIRNEIVAIPFQRTSVKLLGLVRVFNYRGLIGAHTLKPFNLTLDLAKRRLVLRSFEEGLPKGIECSFTEVGGQIILQAFLNKQGPFHLLVDPGAPALVLAPQVAELLGFADSKRFPVELKIEGLPPLEQPALVHKH